MAAEPTRTFEELEAWKGGRAYRMFVYRGVVPRLIERREFDLANQIKRASRSVTHNIAEGHGRFHYRDNYRFCSVARGSLLESLDQLITAADDELIGEAVLNDGRELSEHTLKILNGYMAWLNRSASEAEGPN